MPPERYPKPELTNERAAKLRNDALVMKHALKKRKQWLVLEQSKHPRGDRRQVIDQRIEKINGLLTILEEGKDGLTEDEVVEFLHAGAEVLGTNQYRNTADILTFKRKEQ